MEIFSRIKKNISRICKPQNFISILLNKKNIYKVLIGSFAAFIIIGFSGYKIFQLATKGEDPVSYWKFDEGQGSTAHDSTGLNDSTLGSGTSAPTWVSDGLCFNETCLKFDGSNDYVATADSTSIDFDANDSFTISGWFRTGPKSSGTYSLLNKKETESLAAGSTAVTTIDTSTDAGTASLDASWSDRVVYDPNNNRWHVIYIDSGSDIHTKSTDATSGTSWVDGTDIKTLTYDYEDFNCNGFTEGSRSYMGCTYAESSDEVLYYIRCELTNSGSYISCGSEQTVYTAADPLDDIQTPHIALDANNCGLIVVDYEDASAVAGDTHQVWFFKEDAPCGDGTWTTKSGFPTIVQSEAGYNTDTPVGIRSFSNSLNAQLYWIDTDNFNDVDLETIIFYGATDTFGTQQVINTDVERASDNTYFDAVTFSDKNVSFARDDGTTDIDSHRIDALNGGLSTQVDTLLNVPTASFNSLVTARVDTNSAGGDDIYAFAIDNADSSDIYYNRSTDGAVTWGGSSTLWVNSFDTKVDALSSGYNGDNCDMLVTWVGNSLSPFNINTKLVNTGNCASGVNKGYELQMESDGDITFQVTDGTATDTVTSIAATYDDNQWHYVTAVKNGTTSMTLFIDGKHVATNSSLTATGTLANNNQLYTGIGNNGRTNPYIGFLDEIKIYNYARSEAQIKTDLAAKGAVNGVSAEFGNANEDEHISNGLIGYWKMDEVGVSGTNLTAIDSSGNNSNGTGAGNASVGTTGAGKFGNAVFLDGNGDYITLGTPPVLQPTKITISAWIKTTTGATDIVSKWQSTSGQRGPRLTLNPNNITFQYTTDGELGTSVTVDDTLSVVDGVWHHVVGTYDQKYVRLYVDGVLRKEEAHTDILYYGSKNWEIGRQESGTRQFIGLIDEVRIYNRALDTSEIQVLYNFAPGPVAYYKMDESSGASVSDISGNNNILTGAGSAAPNSVTGKYGNALDFDGVNDKLTAADSSSLDITSPMTVSAWVNPDSLPTSGNLMNIVSKYDTNTNAGGYELALYNEGGTQKIGFLTNDGSIVPARITYTLPTSTWSYLTGVYSGEYWIVYLNGVELGRNASTDTPANNTKLLNIGNFGILTGTGELSRYFAGKIDDVKIYNYARTQKQIVQDMNANHPAPGSPLGSALAHYQLNEGYGSIVNNNGNAGIGLTGIFGTGTSAPTWTNDGKLEKALTFDGTSDYFTVTDNPALDSATEFTVSVWANPTKYTGNSQNQGFMVSKGVFPNYNYRLITDAASGDNRFEVGVQVGSTGFLSLNTTNTFSTNTWYNVVGSYDGNNLKIYVNGELDNSIAVGGTLNTNTTALYVGKYSNGVGYEYKGLLDEIKIYNLALTDDQVKVEYNQGKAQVMGALSTGIGGTTPSNSSSRAYCIPGDTAICDSPVGEWKFDEGSGTIANDTSGTIPGTFGSGNSAPIWTNGKFGKSVMFDGTNDVISTSSSTNLVTGDFTMSGWVYFDVQKNYSGVFGKFNDCAGSPVTAYDFCIGAGATEYWASVTNDAGSSSAQVTITESYAREWMHLTMVWDGVSELKLYKNGILKGTATTALTLSTTKYPVRFGGGAARHMPGKIDEVRLYDYDRTPAQIAWEYNQGKPLVHYQLNECSGSTVYNNTRNGNNVAIGNHGTLTIGASGQTSAGTCASGNTTEAWNNGTTGKIGASINFDGSDDYVTIGDTSLLDFEENADLSLSFWIKPSTLSTAKAIISKKTGNAATANGYMVQTFNGGTLGFYLADSTLANQVLTTTSSSLTTGVWTHVAIVYTAKTTPLIYFNGNRQRTTASGGGTIGTMAALSNGSPLVLAAESDFQLPFYGQLDEVKLFNYPLSPAQVKTEMANGAVRFE